MTTDKQTASVHVDVTSIVKERIATEVATALATPDLITRFVDAVLTKKSSDRYSRDKAKTWLHEQCEEVVKISLQKVVAAQIDKMNDESVAALEKRMGRNAPAAARALADGFLAGMKSNDHRVFRVVFETKDVY